ncbi:cysteine-rich RLK (RECEPTOR-like protein kinase) 8, partial [Striga hermonthica]
NLTSINDLITTLGTQFALKSMGEVNHFLGFEALKSHDGFLLNQSKYALDLLVKTNMVNCKPVSTPLSPASKLHLADSEPFSKVTLYRSVVGALQYLTMTRSDISFAVNKLSQFLHGPTVHHWLACKHLLRYIKGTLSLGLSFQPVKRFTLEAYIDADWASCLDDRRSTGGHFIMLGQNLLCWSSKKQQVVSRSSAESEYRSLATASSDLLWMHSLVHELGLFFESPSILWCDNVSAAALAFNPVQHARTKHIEIDIHFVREKLLPKKL